ncbi:MAG TPA: AAA family ATPase [Clostridium sp.]
MAFKRNTVKVDLGSYPPYIIMGQRKIGKTSLFYKLLLTHYKTLDAGVLISFGNEEGYHSLDDLQYERVVNWSSDEDENGARGFVEAVDDLVENKKSNGVKAVCLDTLDEMIEIGTNEVLRQHKREKGTVCKSLNDAFGGFQRGRDRLLEGVNGQIARLRNAGYAVFILCHTKLKTVKDVMTGEDYEQLTNNLRADFFGSIADKSQMLVNITMEREIVEGKQVSEKRMMYFRNTSVVDAGGRFVGLPEKLELSAENFMLAFETGVKNSMLVPVSDKEIEKKKKVEVKEIASAADVAWKKEQAEIQQELAQDDVAGFITIIQAKFPKAKDEVKEIIRGIMSKYDIANFKSPEELSAEGLKKIVEALS